MFTPEQERWLSQFADKNLAEEAEIVRRNEDVLKEVAVAEQRDAKRIELEARAQALINDGLAEFESTVAPTIRPKE